MTRPHLPRHAGAQRLLLAVFTLLLASCSFTRPAPVKQTYLLDPAPLAATAKPRAGSLRVGVVNVAGAYRDRTFVMRVDDLRYETDYYHEFITPPAPMIAEVTARALAQAGAFTRVTGPGTPGDADYVLDGFVVSLYSDRRESGHADATVAITFYLSEADRGSSVPFWSHTYEQRVVAKSGGVEAYVEALNTALGQVLGDLARDLATIPLPPAMAGS
jgi:cholesterol transport system auxiliary component